MAQKTINITDVHDIDLNRHGFIEASAGTGKTYAIEHLVVRLLTESPALDIDQILIVTFTEKAADELKQRIRDKLEAELKRRGPGDNAYRRLQENLAGFDQAAIGTIHAFCQRLLQDFAFENNALFETKQMDDQRVYHQAFTELVRNIWPQRYGADLPDLLRLSGFSEKWETFRGVVQRLARRFRPAVGDRLMPAADGADYPGLKTRFFQQAADIHALLRQQPDPLSAFKQLNFNARSRQSQADKMVEPLWRWATAANPPDPVSFLTVWERFRTYDRFKKSGLSGVWPIPKWNKGGDNSAEVFPQFSRLVKRLAALLDTFDRTRALLVTQSIVQLHQAAAEMKARNGWISYDDMLTQVHDALQGPGGEALRTHLRNRFPCAFVDEFQDTDPVQWAIFKAIYLDGPQGGGRLFLIGDPKQAIYAFRGADVYVYLTARRHVTGQTSPGGAHLYRLNHNYRSSPNLVKGFNRLFSQASWFGNSSSGTNATPTPNQSKKSQISIPYPPAQSPAETRHLDRMVAPRRSAINVVDLAPVKGLRQARLHLARFIAAEAAYLKESGLTTVSDTRQSKRPVEFNDICVLVRSRTEAQPFEEALDRAGLPYAFYRKQGLFDTAEAFFLSRVLRAVAAPQEVWTVRQALLTPFFDLPLHEIAGLTELPFDHPARQLLQKWQTLAEKRRWGRLFQSLMEASGLIYRSAEGQSWERAATNYHQIFAHLTEKALIEQLDLQGLCTRMEVLRTVSAGDDEVPDTQQIETEAPKVQIMTLHMSKGLQFPVVFVAGGLTRPRRSDGVIYHKETNHRWVRVFDPYGNDTQRPASDELAAESRRLYYVALTRAQQMLYLPYIDPARQRGAKGPLLDFVAKSIKTTLLDGGAARTIPWDSVPAAPRSETSSQASKKTTLPDPLLPPPNDFYPAGLQMSSFTRLQAQRAEAADHAMPQGFSPQEIAPTEVDETHSLDTDWSPTPDLPGGAQMGSFLHLLLERVDYAVAARLPHNRPTRTILNRLMRQYGVDPTWRETIAEMVAAVLTAPIAAITPGFRLADLHPDQRRHEVPFYFHLPPAPPVPETFLRGAVDLIFRAQGRYYIADWKSNRLAAYDPHSLAQSMDQAGYHLQYRLYSLAALRWLEQALGPAFRPEDHFGGVFYFYLRGMGAGRDQGIYFVPPERIGPLERLEAEIEALVAESAAIPGSWSR